MKYALDFITDLIFIKNDPVQADIVLIPGGSRIQLIEKAIELYKQGLVTYILPSGCYNKKLLNSENEWKFMQNIALSNGIPEKVILKEDKAQNTLENAQLSWKVIQENNLNIKKVILVCKAHHAGRALLTYQAVFPSNIKFIVCPIVDERNITKDNWFLDSEKSDIVMSEFEKIKKYFGTHILDLKKN